MYVVLCKLKFLFLLGNYLRVGLLDHIVSVCLASKGTAAPFSRVIIVLCTSTVVYGNYSSSISSLALGGGDIDCILNLELMCCYNLCLPLCPLYPLPQLDSGYGPCSALC